MRSPSRAPRYARIRCVAEARVAGQRNYFDFAFLAQLVVNTHRFEHRVAVGIRRVRESELSRRVEIGFFADYGAVHSRFFAEIVVDVHAQHEQAFSFCHGVTAGFKPSNA